MTYLTTQIHLRCSSRGFSTPLREPSLALQSPLQPLLNSFPPYLPAPPPPTKHTRSMIHWCWITFFSWDTSCPLFSRFWLRLVSLPEALSPGFSWLTPTHPIALTLHTAFSGEPPVSFIVGLSILPRLLHNTLFFLFPSTQSCVIACLVICTPKQTFSSKEQDHIHRIRFISLSSWCILDQ